jgi:hypothetical protein
MKTSTRRKFIRSLTEGKFMFKRKIFNLFAILVLVTWILLSPEVFGLQLEKRVVFPKGKTAAVYQGKLPLNPNYDAYFFRARKSQTLAVKLTSDDPDAYLAIYETKVLGPDQDTILANDDHSREWRGRLPVTGEYSVQVYDASENGLNRFAYAIEISLR